MSCNGTSASPRPHPGRPRDRPQPRQDHQGAAVPARRLRRHPPGRVGHHQRRHHRAGPPPDRGRTAARRAGKPGGRVLPSDRQAPRTTAVCDAQRSGRCAVQGDQYGRATLFVRDPYPPRPSGRRGGPEIVDHFHVVQLANTAVTEVRRRSTMQVRGGRGRKGNREWELRNRLTRSAARMHGCTDARMHGCTDARMHGCTDARPWTGCSVACAGSSGSSARRSHVRQDRRVWERLTCSWDWGCSRPCMGV
ncbi:transposase [Nonomuraea jabiensis]|uniref:transposase n=1 Tax=Nonomuraea jabiensis TaxID=882448 RepID=UPI0036A9E2E1